MGNLKAYRKSPNTLGRTLNQPNHTQNAWREKIQTSTSWIEPQNSPFTRASARRREETALQRRCQRARDELHKPLATDGEDEWRRERQPRTDGVRERPKEARGRLVFTGHTACSQWRETKRWRELGRTVPAGTEAYVLRASAARGRKHTRDGGLPAASTKRTGRRSLGLQLFSFSFIFLFLISFFFPLKSKNNNPKPHI